MVKPILINNYDDEITRLYRMGKSAREIATEINMSKSAVAQRIAKLDLNTLMSNSQSIVKAANVLLEKEERVNTKDLAKVFLQALNDIVNTETENQVLASGISNSILREIKKRYKAGEITFFEAAASLKALGYKLTSFNELHELVQTNKAQSTKEEGWKPPVAFTLPARKD